MIALLTTPTNLYALLTACAIATACAVLSIPVVLRHWAFIGEGIGHSAFGGAGVAWALAVLFPSLDTPAAPYVAAILFCTITALAIGKFSRTGRVNIDAVIGIFLVASLAWGFIAQEIYSQHYHRSPAWFGTFLFGYSTDLSGPAATAATLLSLAVILTVTLLNKEILAYCFDPITALAQGVRTGFIHYLLMLLLALVIVIGMRVVGPVLMTALLVLPGATALLLSRRLSTVVTISISCAVISAIAGLTINAQWRFPLGPSIVLVLVAEFILAYLASWSLSHN